MPWNLYQDFQFNLPLEYSGIFFLRFPGARFQDFPQPKFPQGDLCQDWYANLFKELLSLNISIPVSQSAINGATQTISEEWSLRGNHTPSLRSCRYSVAHFH